MGRAAGSGGREGLAWRGGEIVALGTPEDIVKVKRSYTGAFLAPMLGRRENKRKKGVQAAE
jgi:excinuclease ABC subunit A